MIPSDCGGSRAGRREVGVEQRRMDDAAAVGALEPIEDPAEQPQLAVRLGSVEAPRDVGQRRAGLDQRGGHGQGPRRGIRMGERRGVHDDAGHQGGGQGASVEIERQAEPDREERDHLAGRRGVGSIQSAIAGRRRSRRGGR